ncbi:hypothetical protein K1719_035563 [Acacia pycnantha]|nr:hypothetical protein K1719_035563 [Acacia pycnantha]
MEDYGIGTDFAKVLNSSEGINVDFLDPLCPTFSFEEKEKERLLKPFHRMFPDLPTPLFDKKFLLNLGNSIGKAIRLDVHTAQRARGKFARMCVELDLTKPLVPEVNVEGQLLSVVYESLG